MLRGRLLSLFFALVAASSLCAQPAPVALCIVQTQTDKATHNPSAGPWAIQVHNELSGKQLKNGSPLHITVFPASLQNDILPEVHRLQCARGLQLWYNHSADIRSGVNITNTSHRPAFNSSPGADPASISYEDSLFCSLWDAATEKVLGRGSVPLRAPSGPAAAPDIKPSTTSAEQTLKWLNRGLH